MSESTKAGHTTGRLSLQERGALVILRAENGDNVARLSEYGEQSETPGAHYANAARLAACWNACEGIPDEGLQALVVPKILLDQADTERDALRTQISDMARQCNDWTRRFAESVQAQDALRSEVEILRAALSDFMRPWDMGVKFADMDVDAIERIRDNARAALGGGKP